jgi:hypothetical protein
MPVNKDKKAKIAECISKGAEWCASKLWDAREENRELKKHKHKWLRERDEALAEAKMVYPIESANECLREVLEENGIRPTKLTLYYLHLACDICRLDRGVTQMYGDEEVMVDDDDCCGKYDDDRCQNYTENVVKLTSWWTYEINDGYIKGIISSFNHEHFSCYKIVNENTGEIIYQAEKDE